MQSYLFLIIQFFTFWFIEAPKSIIDYLFSFNTAMLKFFSFTVLLSTFFRPWKNEYRQGLVGFSIVMGMGIKSMLIFFDLIIFIVVIAIELCLVFLFMIWPVLTVAILFL